MNPTDLSALASQHLAIVGRVGSGKTYTAKGMVELLLAEKRRVCILDPTGVWWGLRSSADGARPGWPVVVFGGPRADDGDALRLAVKLDIWVHPGEMHEVVEAVGIKAVRLEAGDDRLAATRRAIVRAAAAIGKGMS